LDTERLTAEHLKHGLACSRVVSRPGWCRKRSISSARSSDRNALGLW